MNWLSKLISSPAAKPSTVSQGVRPQATQQKKSTQTNSEQRAPSASPQKANVVPIRERQPEPGQVEASAGKPRSASKAITAIKELGTYQLESDPANGSFPLSAEACKSIAILYHSSENEYSVVATPDVYASAGYMSVVDKVSAQKKCPVRQIKVDPGIIERIYRANAESQEDDEQNTELINVMRSVAHSALENNASDIHIEKRSSEARVSFRVFGDIVHDQYNWTGEYAERLARALHWKADADSKDTTWSSNAQMAVSLVLPDGEKVKLRVQCADAYPDGGLDIVTRILRVGANTKIRSYEELGYEGEQLVEIDYMIHDPKGLICLSGTTGSGKSTTMQTTMCEFGRGGHKKLISIEDPPEYVMPNVTQMPVPRRNQDAAQNINPFANCLIAAMRMDPDVLMIGEIRDEMTAKLAADAVITGHKVLTSVHALSAQDIITRMRGFQISHSILGGSTFISGFIHQSLVPILCDHCKVGFGWKPDDDAGVTQGLIERLKAVTKEGDQIYLRGAGCARCSDRGVVGRTVCAEVLIFNDAMKKAVVEGSMIALREKVKALRENVVRSNPDSLKYASAREHAISKMRRGIISPVDVEACVEILYDPNDGMSFDAVLN